MKIFIGFATFSETFIFYQINLVYEFFKQNGYNLVKDAANSDIIILAGVPFNIFENIKTLLTINYYLKKYPDKEIITIGHLSDMINGLKSFGKLRVIGLSNLNIFDNLFSHTISINNVEVSVIRYFLPLNLDGLCIINFGYEIDIKSDYKYTDVDLTITVDKLIQGNHDITGIYEYDSKYSYLEDLTGNLYIQTCFGCSAKCSYCVINKVGFVKSKPIDEILNEITKGISKGKKIIHIFDQDTGSYGVDIGLDFAYLLNEINKIDGDFKIKIRYIEPGKLEKLYCKIDKTVWLKIIYFGVQLQTTSQRILKLMNRSYNIPNIINIVNDIRQSNNKIHIVTEFIYGFPTETFDEFKDYFRMKKYFDYMDITMYSEKKELKLFNTPKNELSDIYKKYIYFRKIHELFPNEIGDSYFGDIDVSLIIKRLY